MENIVKDIVDYIFKLLEPELKKAMIQRILEVSLDRWKFVFASDEQITDMIKSEVKRKIEIEFAAVLNYIADKKAREKILRRAEQNGIKKHEILSLFEL